MNWDMAEALILGVTALIGLAALLITNWDGVAGFFSDLWTSLKETFASGIDYIMGFINLVMDPIKNLKESFTGLSLKSKILFDKGKDEFENQSKIVTPQERVANQISETTETNNSTASLLIKDETGKAQLTQKGSAPGTSIKLMKTGGL